MFNARKTKCMIVLPNKRRTSLTHLDSCVFRIDNKPIEFVDSFSHLGHVITSSLCDSEDIAKRRGEFVGQVNNVLCYFCKLSPSVRYNLFRSYCTSLYGCELWLLDNNSIDDLCIAWRKGLRKIWNVSPRTHCSLLPLICNCLPLFDELCQRFLKFAHKCLFHGTDLVRSVALYSILYGRGFSLLGRNVSFCMQRYDISVLDVFNGAFAGSIHVFVRNSYDAHTLALANLLGELLQLRDGALELPLSQLSIGDINAIIDFICSG